jgi:hypothetical protein
MIGGDGKTYGPIGLEDLKKWVAQGRVNVQTQVQAEGSPEWKAAREIPELAPLFQAGTPAGSLPPPISSIASAAPEGGLAITSLVLGILSLVCLGILAGIPAIICGHIARSRAKQQPAQYGGAGQALAGLILGYVSIFLTLVILPAMLLPALVRAKYRAQQINCVNNMKQVGLAFRTWAVDHGDKFPFNVSTKSGGTLELCSVGPGGFDQNGAVHLMVMSNELSNPKILVCPADSKHSGIDFQSLTAANVTYQVYSGTDINDTNPQAVLAVCPVHGTTLLCDGSVQLNWRRR